MLEMNKKRDKSYELYLFVRGDVTVQRLDFRRFFIINPIVKVLNYLKFTEKKQFKNLFNFSKHCQF